MYVACSTSGSSVSLSDVGCSSIFPNYDPMAQALDRPSQIYLGRGSEGFDFQSGSLALGIPGGRIRN